MSDILIVEDETVLARSMVGFLERRGFSAEFAEPRLRKSLGRLTRASVPNGSRTRALLRCSTLASQAFMSGNQAKEQMASPGY